MTNVVWYGHGYGSSNGFLNIFSCCSYTPGGRKGRLALCFLAFWHMCGGRLQAVPRGGGEAARALSGRRQPRRPDSVLTDTAQGLRVAAGGPAIGARGSHLQGWTPLVALSWPSLWAVVQQILAQCSTGRASTRTTTHTRIPWMGWGGGKRHNCPQLPWSMQRYPGRTLPKKVKQRIKTSTGPSFALTVRSDWHHRMPPQKVRQTLVRLTEMRVSD